MKIFKKIEELGIKFRKEIESFREVFSLGEDGDYKAGYLDGQIDMTEQVVAELRPLWYTAKKEWDEYDRENRREKDELRTSLEEANNEVLVYTEKAARAENRLKALEDDYRLAKEEVDRLKGNDKTTHDYEKILVQEKNNAWKEAKQYYSVEVEYLKRVMRDNGLDPDNITDTGSSHD